MTVLGEFLLSQSPRSIAASDISIFGYAFFAGSWEDPAGNRKQKNLIRRYVRRSRGRWLHILSDQNLADGPSLLQRPRLGRLLMKLQDCKGSKILVLDSLARLDQEPILQHGMLQYLAELGVLVFFCGDTQEKSSPVPNRLAPRGGNAHDKIAMLKRQLTRLTKKTRPGPRRFGTLDQERPSIERLLELRRGLVRVSVNDKRRLSFATIAAKLNQEGHVRRNGRGWNGPAVRHAIELFRPNWLPNKKH